MGFLIFLGGAVFGAIIGAAIMCCMRIGSIEDNKKTHSEGNKSFLNYTIEVSLIRNRLGFELLISVIRLVNPLFENTP